MHTANELWLRYHFKSYEKTEALTTQFNSRTGFGLECAFKFNKDSDQDDDNRLYTIFPWWGSRVGASWLQKAIWWSGDPFIVGLDAICVKPTLEIQLTTSGSTPRLYKKKDWERKTTFSMNGNLTTDSEFEKGDTLWEAQTMKFQLGTRE